MISTFKEFVRRTLAKKNASSEPESAPDPDPAHEVPQQMDARGSAGTSDAAVAQGITVDDARTGTGGAGLSGSGPDAAAASGADDASADGTRVDEASADDTRPDGAGADGGAVADAGAEEATGPNAEAETASSSAAAPPVKRRTTARRAPKLDQILADALDTARAGVLEIAAPEQVGEHAGVRAEDDRVVTHLFESSLPGYQGWQWFAVLTRVPRAKIATVSEVGLLPSERSVLSPQWVPWAQRVRPGDEQAHAELEAARQKSGG